MIERVVEHFGSKAAMASALGVTRPAVSQWVALGSLPPFRAVQIERVTAGEFKAIDLISQDDKGAIRD